MWFDAFNEEDTPVGVDNITLQSQPAYDKNIECGYMFTAILPEGYVLAQDATLPQISLCQTVDVVRRLEREKAVEPEPKIYPEGIKIEETEDADPQAHNRLYHELKELRKESYTKEKQRKIMGEYTRRSVFVKKPKRLISILIALVLVLTLVPVIVLAQNEAKQKEMGSTESDVEQVADVPDITLATLSPSSFPAEGKAVEKSDMYATIGEGSTGVLEQGAEVKVTDCMVVNGVAWLAVENESSTVYIKETGMDITFARPVMGKVLADSYAYAQKQETEDDKARTLLLEGYYVNVSGREGDWWVLADSNDNAIYAKEESISIQPNIAKRFTEKGEYGTDTVETIAGDVVISADVTLKNMVIEGNLYILDGVKKITLNDAYVSHSTIPLGDMEIENNMTKVMENMGDPAKITSGLFRKNYPEVDVEQLTEDAVQLMDQINTAVFADGEVE